MECVNRPGSFECRCKDGFDGDQRRGCAVSTTSCNQFSAELDSAGQNENSAWMPLELVGALL
ncbi:unnamed protein product [Heligmosomoides polygyrus]|uniref:EGF-like domain-containing protein n=1 Tax=Heligmosomoides polygyrus TaxID=6339 RepID=A0A183FKF0_HELPZ|nr:unnamed protein product [Heligmosomoides polygyrus]